MPRRVPLDPRFLHLPFTVAEARSSGLGKRRLAGADLKRPFHGIRSRVVDDARVLGLCRAFRPRLRAGQFFSHATAALIHGMPLPQVHEQDLRLHVTSISPASVVRTNGVVGHSTDGRKARVARRLGYPVSAPLQTWCELAAVLDRDDLVAVADFMLSGQHPMTSPGELRVAARAWGRQRGAPKLRAAAELARDGVDSRMESLMRMLVVDAGFPEPVINGIVTDDLGNWVAQSDLVFPEFKVVVEYDGDDHRGRKRFLDDIDRRQRIEAAGWHFIQLSPRHIYRRRAEAVQLIAKHLTEGGWSGRAILPA